MRAAGMLAAAGVGVGLVLAFRRPSKKRAPAPEKPTMRFAPEDQGGGCSGAEWAASLPANQTDAQAQILQAVREGCALLSWIPITTTFNGHTAVIPISSDALRIGRPGDAVRPAVSYRTLQAVADELGASLMTSKVSDQAWQEATAKLTPSMFNRTKADLAVMGTTKRMLDHSRAVDKKLANADDSLVGNPGKSWLITRRWAEAPSALVPNPKAASANYGWYMKGAGSWNPPHTLELAQSIGLRHPIDHVDYSQQGQLMGGTIEVDGEPMPFSEVARSPELAGLVSDEGILPYTRHPLLGGALLSNA